LVAGAHKLTNIRQTPNTDVLSMAVRRRALRSVVERETAQITN
jgi:hypothetical protein